MTKIIKIAIAAGSAVLLGGGALFAARYKKIKAEYEAEEKEKRDKARDLEIAKTILESVTVGEEIEIKDQPKDEETLKREEQEEEDRIYKQMKEKEAAKEKNNKQK